MVRLKKKKTHNIYTYVPLFFFLKNVDKSQKTKAKTQETPRVNINSGKKTENRCCKCQP